MFTELIWYKSHSAQITLFTETFGTQQNIIAAFDKIITRVHPNHNANIIIYYFEHGQYIQRSNEYFPVLYSYNPSQCAGT